MYGRRPVSNGFAGPERSTARPMTSDWAEAG